MAISSIGIGSNLPIDAIIEGLMNAERRPLDLVGQQKAGYQAQVSAYGTLKSALASFQSAVAKLADTGKFTVQSATSSDSAAFTASANGKAVEGNYALKVVQLAQSQKIAAAGVASPYTAIGTGKLTISFGTYDADGNSFTLNPDAPATSIDITPANNTLAGIRDAINDADAGVTATIVNDGQANRLVITSSETGSKHSMRISVADDDGGNSDGNGLSQLAFDPTQAAGSGKNLSVLQQAQDAVVDIDGVRVTKPGNSINDALDGITLNLLKADPDKALNLGVARDDAAIESSVKAFVKAYNDVNQTLRNLTSYDVESKTGGPLAGDATARSIATQIKQSMTSALTAAGDISTLTQIGVSFQRDGTLALDSARLKTAIKEHPQDIAYLFAAGGRASDLQVSQVGQTDKTRPGTYAVNVTRLATQGSLQGAAAPALDIAAGVNDTLDLKIDGAKFNIKLDAASYASVDALAEQLQMQLSAAGARAQVIVADGKLQLVSASYGSTSTVVVEGGNAATDLFGASPVSSAGLNVAGTINGVAATGKGQVLVGADGDDSAGLSIRIAGGALGDRGTISYTTGYAFQLDRLVDRLLDDENGLLATRTEGIKDSIERLTDRQEAMQDRLAMVEQRYRAQFTALDVLLSNLQQTSAYMTQQLAQLSANNGN